MGVEPTSPAWKAGVIAVIRQPHDEFILAKNTGECQALTFARLLRTIVKAAFCRRGRKPRSGFRQAVCR